RNGTLVPFAVGGRRAVDQTVIGESGHHGFDVVTVHGVAVPLDGGPDFVCRFEAIDPAGSFGRTVSGMQSWRRWYVWSGDYAGSQYGRFLRTTTSALLPRTRSARRITRRPTWAKCCRLLSGSAMAMRSPGSMSGRRLRT